MKKQLFCFVLIWSLFLIPDSALSQLGVKLGRDKSGPAPIIGFAHSDETNLLAVGGSVAIKGALELGLGITLPFGKNRNIDVTTISGSASYYLLNNESLPIAISLDASIQDSEFSDALTVLGSTIYVGDSQQFLLSVSPLYLLRGSLDKKTGLSIGLHIMGDKFILSPFYTFLPERLFNNSIGISASYIIQKREKGGQM